MKKSIFIYLTVLLMSSCSSFVPKDEIEQKKYDMIQRIFNEPEKYAEIVNSSGFKLAWQYYPEPVFLYDYEWCCKQVKLTTLIKTSGKPTFYCNDYSWVYIEKDSNLYCNYIIYEAEYDDNTIYLQFTWFLNNNEWIFSKIIGVEVPLCH